MTPPSPPAPPALPPDPADPPASDPSAPSAPPAATTNDRFVTFTQDELRRVLGRFAIGAVHEARPLLAGGSASAKAVVTADAGRFLLKRRPPGADAVGVAIGHEVRLHLAARGFCAPAPLGAEPDQNTILHTDTGFLYELTPFVEAETFEGNAPNAGARVRAAGATLARLHALLADLTPSWPVPETTDHADASLPGRLIGHADRLGDHARSLSAELAELYRLAADRAEPVGPRALLHGDWHPGNLLFAGDHVAGVVDFDAVRAGPRALDAASGMLQFALPFPRRNPDGWASSLDGGRLAQFCIGYDGVEVQTGSVGHDWAEPAPWLMIETLIGEGTRAIGVCTTPREAGTSLLDMVHRVARWIERNADQITGLIRSARGQ